MLLKVPDSFMILLSKTACWFDIIKNEIYQYLLDNLELKYGMKYDYVIPKI